MVGRLDADGQDALLRDVAGVLRPHTDDRGVVFPFETVVVTASR